MVNRLSFPLLLTLIVALLGSCNPPRQLGFDFKLYGTWKIKDDAERTTESYEAFPIDAMEVTEDGRINGFVRAQAILGSHLIARIQDSKLLLENVQAERVADYILKLDSTPEATPATTTIDDGETSAQFVERLDETVDPRARVIAKLQAVGVFLSLKTKDDAVIKADLSGVSDKAGKIEIPLVRISKDEYDAAIQTEMKITRKR